MKSLQDKHLIDCYWKAVEYKLDTDFINLLIKEIKKRNLQSAILVEA